VQGKVRFLNTVIGKMSGAVADAEQIERQGLVTLTAAHRGAFLVESFNRILISKIDFPERGQPFSRGIEIFEEKPDLLIFEEAKLYGHNGLHALAAFVGGELGLKYIADLRSRSGALPFLRAAAIEEAGEALVRKHWRRDPLFSFRDFRDYVEDLLERMLNPHLGDTIERISRDPERKLGWDDRFIGLLRLARQQRIRSPRFAFGAALALERLRPGFLESQASPAGLLEPLWAGAAPVASEFEAVVEMFSAARRRYRAWKGAGSPDLEIYFCRDF
jgi:mannitol-1-phosphate 5-dehydrogenase